LCFFIYVIQVMEWPPLGASLYRFLGWSFRINDPFPCRNDSLFYPVKLFLGVFVLISLLMDVLPSRPNLCLGVDGIAFLAILQVSRIGKLLLLIYPLLNERIKSTVL